MRLILFRGKRVNNGMWEIGSLMQRGINRIPYIADKMTGHLALVDPRTVGQFTGVTNSRDQRIYEDDIVLHAGARFRVAMREGQWVLLDKYGYWCELYPYAADCEIIGNIHDDPKLMEASKDV